MFMFIFIEFQKDTQFIQHLVTKALKGSFNPERKALGFLSFEGCTGRHRCVNNAEATGHRRTVLTATARGSGTVSTSECKHRFRFDLCSF